MTDLATGLGVRPRSGAQSRAITAEPAQTPTLNTGQRVLISSAAALAGSKVRLHRLLAALRAHFMRAENIDQPKHYPNYYSFIEDAAMSREMYRL